MRRWSLIPPSTHNTKERIMSVRESFIDKAFAGNSIPFQQIAIKETTGAPAGAELTGSGIGQLWYNSFDDDCYITTVADTTVVKMNA